MARKKYFRATPKQFIEAWQTSESTAEVAAKLRMNTQQVRVRACRYRRRGVPLKMYEWPDPPDWEELADYAASLLPDEDETPDAALHSSKPVEAPSSLAPAN